ncbi:hypothetical protein HDU96_002414 [Phlyctochytrium bullatum]|nr:hypothetical protein HDU96_002414 [Phlyctochytrium bullatum]
MDPTDCDPFGDPSIANRCPTVWDDATDSKPVGGRMPPKKPDVRRSVSLAAASMRNESWGADISIPGAMIPRSVIDFSKPDLPIPNPDAATPAKRGKGGDWVLVGKSRRRTSSASSTSLLLPSDCAEDRPAWDGGPNAGLSASRRHSSIPTRHPQKPQLVGQSAPGYAACAAEPVATQPSPATSGKRRSISAGWGSTAFALSFSNRGHLMLPDSGLDGVEEEEGKDKVRSFSSSWGLPSQAISLVLPSGRGRSSPVEEKAMVEEESVNGDGNIPLDVLLEACSVGSKPSTWRHENRLDGGNAENALPARRATVSGTPGTPPVDAKTQAQSTYLSMRRPRTVEKMSTRRTWGLRNVSSRAGPSDSAAPTLGFPVRSLSSPVPTTATAWAVHSNMSSRSPNLIDFDANNAQPALSSKNAASSTVSASNGNETDPTDSGFQSGTATPTLQAPLIGTQGTVYDINPTGSFRFAGTSRTTMSPTSGSPPSTPSTSLLLQLNGAKRRAANAAKKLSKLERQETEETLTAAGLSMGPQSAGLVTGKVRGSPSLRSLLVSGFPQPSAPTASVSLVDAGAQLVGTSPPLQRKFGDLDLQRRPSAVTSIAGLKGCHPRGPVNAAAPTASREPVVHRRHSIAVASPTAIVRLPASRQNPVEAPRSAPVSSPTEPDALSPVASPPTTRRKGSGMARVLSLLGLGRRPRCASLAADTPTNERMVSGRRDGLVPVAVAVVPQAPAAVLNVTAEQGRAEDVEEGSPFDDPEEDVDAFGPPQQLVTCLDLAVHGDRLRNWSGSA